MLKFTLVIFFITTFHILPVYSQNKGDSIRLTIRNLIPIAHDYVTMNYNDRYYDLKYKVLTDQKTTFSFPADEKYKVLLFRYNNLSFSYLVFTGDSLEITYDKNNNLRARSLSNHPFIKISEEIHDKAGDMFDLSFEVISYKRLNSYLSSIYEKYTKRRNILDSISASLSLDTNQQRVFQSELYGKYLIDKFLPFYQQRPLNIDSLPSYYKKEMGEARSYFNEKEINRSTNENRMAAHDYFKFYLCNYKKPPTLKEALSILQQNFDKYWQDILAFKFIRDDYTKLRISEKPLIEDYKHNLASVGNANYLSVLESKYLDFKQEDIASAEFITIKGDKVSLKDILSKNKGKVVYIDFWASWCYPCIGEMPASEKLRQQFTGKDIVFVYISIDKDKDKWVKAAQKLKLTENSYVLSAENNPLIEKLSVKSIPRYIIVDKNNSVLDQNALRPSDPKIASDLAQIISP
jgi:thiol-disulfide isomerase/thioredoxin